MSGLYVFDGFGSRLHRLGELCVKVSCDGPPEPMVDVEAQVVLLAFFMVAG